MNESLVMSPRQRALEVTDRLQSIYHAEVSHFRAPGACLTPVDELILTVLSQSTTDTNSWRGFQHLRASFPSWDDVADAPLAEVEHAIHACGLAHQKAPRLQAILQRLRVEQGAITLDFLADRSPMEACDYLTSFHGVGRKTAACVLLFALGMPALPVDTHVLRLAWRLQFIPNGVTAARAHDLLEALLPPNAYLAFHLNIITHGRQVCHARHPACERCCLFDLCPFGQTRT